MSRSLPSTSLPRGLHRWIYSSHVLEHFAYPQSLGGLLAECRRILKPGSFFSAAVPDARPYLEGYFHPKGFDPAVRCLYPPYHCHSAIDYVNHIAYVDGYHHHMFDGEPNGDPQASGIRRGSGAGVRSVHRSRRETTRVDLRFVQEARVDTGGGN